MTRLYVPRCRHSSIFLWNQSCSCSGSGCCCLHPCGRHSFLELSAPLWQTLLLAVVCAFVADTAACLTAAGSCLLLVLAELQGHSLANSQANCGLPWPLPGRPLFLLPRASPTYCLLCCLLLPTPAILPAQSLDQPGDLPSPLPS